MPIRLILILVIAALIVAVFFADPIYDWFCRSIFKNDKSARNTNNNNNDEKGESE